MNNILIIGIDPSITSTGLSIAGYRQNHDDKEYLTQTTVAMLSHFGSDKKAETSLRRERCDILARGIFDGLDEFLYIYPEYKTAHVVIGIELYLLKAKGMVATIAEMHGYLKGCLLTRYILGHFDFSNFDMYEFHNQTAKKWIAGTGGAKKLDIRKAILQKYGIDIPNNDECDAFALMKMTENLLANKLTEYEVQKVKKF